MVALECHLAGIPTHLLGVDTPLEEIARAVQETRAAAVGISVSLGTGGVKTDRLLAELRQALEPEVRVLVGGAGARGARRGPHGVEYAVTWDELERWLRELAVAHP
jgi:methylmalonyl-CoA mutase cobalamin-binding subunit